MSKNWHELEKETIRIQHRFKKELEMLRAQGVLSNVDVQKVMNQVSVSKQALLETVRRDDLDAEIREDLFVSLLRDYQISIQKIIDDAVLRLGPDAFIIYKFNQVNEKALDYAYKSNFTNAQISSLKEFMAGATAYALKTLPQRRTWRVKTNFQKMINNYSDILRQYIASLDKGKVFQLLPPRRM